MGIFVCKIPLRFGLSLPKLADWSTGILRLLLVFPKLPAACSSVTLSAINCPLIKVYWVLSHAICLEYEDNGDQYNASASSHIQNSQLNTPEFATAVSTMARTMQVEEAESTLQTLQKLQVVVGRKCNPQALRNAALAKQATARGVGNRCSTSVNLAEFPLGFSTGGMHFFIPVNVYPCFV